MTTVSAWVPLPQPPPPPPQPGESPPGIEIDATTPLATPLPEDALPPKVEGLQFGEQQPDGSVVRLFALDAEHLRHALNPNLGLDPRPGAMLTEGLYGVSLAVFPEMYGPDPEHQATHVRAIWK